MPIEPEQFELPTRNNMVHETPYDTPIRARTEEEDDDLGLSEGENNDSVELIRECMPLQYFRAWCLYSHRLIIPSLILLSVFPSERYGGSVLGLRGGRCVLLSPDPFSKPAHLSRSQGNGGVSFVSVSPSFCSA
jgi:hypothetical protein